MSNGGALESGIPCPICNSTRNRVVLSRQRNGGIYRRRKCSDCGKAFATHEVHAVGDFRARAEPGSSESSEKVVAPKVAVAAEAPAPPKPAPPQMRQVIVERNDNCLKCGRAFGLDVFRDWFDERRCQDCANEASEEQQP